MALVFDVEYCTASIRVLCFLWRSTTPQAFTVELEFIVFTVEEYCFCCGGVLRNKFSLWSIAAVVFTVEEYCFCGGVLFLCGRVSFAM